MKFRVLIILAITFAGIFSMTSCVKEYTCRCTIKYSGVPGLPDSSINEFTIKDTKSKAETNCKAGSAVIDKNNVHTVENCKLY